MATAALDTHPPRSSIRSRTAGRCRPPGTRTPTSTRASASGLSRARGRTPGRPSGSRSRARTSPRTSATSRSRSCAEPTARCAASSTSAATAVTSSSTERGCRETLQCPYHAWTYDLDGTLRTRAALGARAGLRPRRTLARARLGRHVGPVRLRQPRSRTQRRSTRRSASLPAIVAQSGLDIDAIRFHSHHEWPIEANWKVVMENFLECYHCPTAHPGFSKVIDVNPDSYLPAGAPDLLEPDRPGSRVGARGERQGAVHADAATSSQAQYHFLFPSTTLNIAPGIPNISLERYLPDGLRAHGRGDGLLLRRGRVRRGDRGARSPGTRRSPRRTSRSCSRCSAGSSPGAVPAGSAHGREREAHRRLPAPRVRRLDR